MRWGTGAGLIALGVASAPTAAQSVRLNGPLAQPPAGDVLAYEISPDGTHAIYSADQAHDDVVELFAAPLDGSAAPVRLHAPQPALSPKDVQAFAVGAGGLVAFIADLGTDESFELYVAPLAGSISPTVLSGTLVPGGDVLDLRLTPDGTRVVFRADKLVDDEIDLFSVPLDGSSLPVPLDPPPGRDCTHVYRISPDGAFVVYATDEFDFDSGFDRLHRVPVDGSAAPLQLAVSGPGGFPTTHTFFADVTLASDGQHAAAVRVIPLSGRGFEPYLADLYGLVLDGSAAPTKLNLASADTVQPKHAVTGDRVVFTEPDGELVTVRSDGSGRVHLGADVGEFVLSQDGTRVVFVQGAPGASTLRIAPTDGSSPPVVLAGPGTLESPRISANNALIAFIGTAPGSLFRGLLAVAVAGGPPLLLNGPVVPGGRGVQDFAIAPGARIVYREDRAVDEVFQLWSVGFDLVPRELSGPLGGFRDVLSFRIALDGQRVAYLADQDIDQVDELFATPIDGHAPPVVLNEPMADGPVVGDVASFQPSPDGTRVLYRADQEVDEFVDLYATPLGGHRAPVRLTAPLSDIGNVRTDFAFTPAGDRVVAEFEILLGPTLLFVSPTTGASPAVVLDTSPDGFAPPFEVDPSGTFVVYRKIDDQGWRSLHRVDLDGTQTPVTLADPPGSRTVGAFDITPDGGSVIYTAHPDAGDSPQLFRIPSDASSAPIQLNQTVANGLVASFALSPDGSRVVYRFRHGGPLELYSVPSDGSGTPVRLNGPMVFVGQVTGFAITPDGTRVVYRADELATERFELFSAPIAGGTQRVRLTALPDSRQVEPDFAVSPDGQFVLYRADALAFDVVELFVVRTDGGAAPLRLSGAQVPGGDVTAFALARNQSHVVYLADQRRDETFELFTVPALGGTPLAPLRIGADVTAFRIDHESRWIVFTGNLESLRVELFRSPLDASTPPERISLDMHVGSNVQTDFVLLPAGRVLYRADEDNDVFELFLYPGVDPLQAHDDPTESRSVVR